MAAMFIMVALLLLLVEPASTEMPLSDIAGERDARDKLESSGMGGGPAREHATEAAKLNPSRLPFKAASGVMTGILGGRKSVSVARATISSVRMPAARLNAVSFSNEE